MKTFPSPEFFRCFSDYTVHYIQYGRNFGKYIKYTKNNHLPKDDYY